jgi:hypothetical protein
MIEVLSTLRRAASRQQRESHHTVSYHERNSRSLLLGQRQVLIRKCAQSVGIKRRRVRNPDAKKDRVQQRRIFGRLAEGFGLFDQDTRPLGSRLGLG